MYRYQSQLTKSTGLTEEMADDDCFSFFKMPDSQLSTVRKINYVLSATFGRKVDVTVFFPDVKRFLILAVKIQQTVSNERLSRRKRFRLEK